MSSAKPEGGRFHCRLAEAVTNGNGESVVLPSVDIDPICTYVSSGEVGPEVDPPISRTVYKGFLQ